MPLKIVTENEQGQPKFDEACLATNNTPQLVIRLQELLTAKADFTAKYKDEGGSPFVSEFMVKWIDFKNRVLSCGYDEEDIVLNFIHRYDHANLQWFLTVECCKKESDSASSQPDFIKIDGIGHYIFNIIERGIRFDIKNGVVSPTTTLPHEVADHDIEYFTRVTCQDASLVQGEHVASISFPWKKELVKLHSNNHEFDEGDDVFIKFVSATADSDMPDPPPIGFDYRDTLVQWPHGLMIHMHKAGSDLMNNSSQATIFKSRACNYGSMCPPRCNDYFMLDYL